MQVTFEDITVSFSQEEWGYLAEEQKELYREVMKENYQTLISLGTDSPNVTPDSVSHIEQGEEPYIKSEPGSEESETGRSSCSGDMAEYMQQAYTEEGEVSSQSASVKTKRTRAPKFSDEELEILVHRVGSEFSRLSKKSRLSNGQKNQLWAQIAADVSALGVKKRTVKQVKHRWQDIRSVVKEKARKVWKRRRGAEECSRCDMRLSSLEECVLSTIRYDQVLGLRGGIDTSAVPTSEENEEDPGVRTSIGVPGAPCLSCTSEHTEIGAGPLSPTHQAAEPVDTPKEELVLPLAAEPEDPPKEEMVLIQIAEPEDPPKEELILLQIAEPVDLPKEELVLPQATEPVDPPKEELVLPQATEPADPPRETLVLPRAAEPTDPPRETLVLPRAAEPADPPRDRLVLARAKEARQLNQVWDKQEKWNAGTHSLLAQIVEGTEATRGQTQLACDATCKHMSKVSGVIMQEMSRHFLDLQRQNQLLIQELQRQNQLLIQELQRQNQSLIQELRQVQRELSCLREDPGKPLAATGLQDGLPGCQTPLLLPFSHCPSSKYVRAGPPTPTIPPGPHTATGGAVQQALVDRQEGDCQRSSYTC
nr:nuclear receptor corepressor 2-like isoform X2 [Geotrypetes seraphini]XP_033788218.1 nuclear receptor corepressor 2-like isoform X2 [Geotrypetes seraphini]XP_033788219.1 nuclear receptor corepressor 2-like isoform X2 [Geotrypetes seraphini]